MFLSCISTNKQTFYLESLSSQVIIPGTHRVLYLFSKNGCKSSRSEHSEEIAVFKKRFMSGNAA